jgi:proteasome accessory factor B
VSNQKTERLINLTMALLATKRFLSKSEIFSKVAGYSGSSETMERLFERDKDDLRTLGIPIQVGSHDPLFSDEPGYRIPESEYALTLGELTPTELSYLSLAAKLWRNQLFSESGALALLKIDALGGPIFTEEFGQSLLSLENESPLFPSLWEAINSHRIISFVYRSKSVATRSVAPYGLTLWHGSWYLVGEDLEKREIRVFRISRICSTVSFTSNADEFEVPGDFSIKQHLIMLEPEIVFHFTARARVGTCQSLRLLSSVESVDGEWDLLTFPLGNGWLEQVLWFGSDLVLLSPAEKVAEIYDLLKEKS